MTRLADNRPLETVIAQYVERELGMRSAHMEQQTALMKITGLTPPPIEYKLYPRDFCVVVDFSGHQKRITIKPAEQCSEPSKASHVIGMFFHDIRHKNDRLMVTEKIVEKPWTLFRKSTSPIQVEQPRFRAGDDAVIAADETSLVTALNQVLSTNNQIPAPAQGVSRA